MPHFFFPGVGGVGEIVFVAIRCVCSMLVLERLGGLSAVPSEAISRLKGVKKSELRLCRVYKGRKAT